MKHFFAPLCLAVCTTLHAQFGALDPSFGGSGIVQTDAGGPTSGFALAVQADGRIVCAGGVDSSAVLVRYLPNGSLDASFGSGGIVVQDYLDYCVFGQVLVQPDGKIVAAGRSQDSYSNFFVMRFFADGTVDNAFGIAGTGIVNISFAPLNCLLADLAIQSDGKILFTGSTTTGSNSSVRVIRLTTDGLTDGGFGAGAGTATITVSTTIDSGRSLAVQSDGKVLVGFNSLSSGQLDMAVARLLTNGSLDPTFGSSGIMVLTDIGMTLDNPLGDVLLQADGKIILCGQEVIGTTERHVQFVRLNTDGTTDTSYGVGGECTGPAMGGAIFPQRGAMQADGKAVFVATYNTTGPFVAHPTVWRANSDGTLDASFGTSGQVEEPLGTGGSYLFNTALQNDGKLLLCGQGPGSQLMTVARLTTGQQTGVEDHPTASGPRVFPNPTQGLLMVSQRTPLEAGSMITIRDLAGREVLRERSINSSTQAIDVSALPVGQYTLTLCASHELRTIPFTKL